MSEFSEKIRSIIARDLNLATWVITPDTPLGRLGADDLDAIGLIMAVERELGICLPNDAFRSQDLPDGEWTFGRFVQALESFVSPDQGSVSARPQVEEVLQPA